MVAMSDSTLQELKSAIYAKKILYMFFQMVRSEKVAVRSIRIPTKCWIIKRRKMQSYMTGRITDGKEFILVFSSEKRAMGFLRNIKRSRRLYDIIPLSWKNFVEIFKSEYSFVAIDDPGIINAQTTIIAIS